MLFKSTSRKLIVVINVVIVINKYVTNCASLTSTFLSKKPETIESNMNKTIIIKYIIYILLLYFLLIYKKLLKFLN